MRKKKRLIIITILFMAIGFATVTTTLVMTGTLKISSNQKDYEMKKQK